MTLRFMSTRFALFLLTAAILHTPTALAADLPLPCTHGGPKLAACQQEEFSQLAAHLAATTEQAELPLSATARLAVESDGAQWLRWTQRICPAQKAECLTPLYQAQEARLTDGSARVDGRVIYPRAQYRIGPLTRRGTHQGKRLPWDPGFGVSAVSWPQIDRPNADETIWNHAMQQKAQAMATRTNQDDALFSPLPLVGKQVNLSYQMAASNPRLLQVSFDLEVSPYEAAHPASTAEQVGWWVHQRHGLTAQDLFRAANWRESLTQACVAALVLKAKQSRGQFVLFDAKDWQPQLAAIATNPANWTLTQAGLTLTLPRYSVAAGVYGNPQVTIAWKHLESLRLNKMNLASLPGKP